MTRNQLSVFFLVFGLTGVANAGVMRTSGSNVSTLGPASGSSAGVPDFARVEGLAPGEDPKKVLAEIHAAFDDRLDKIGAAGKSVLYSFNGLVDGAGHYFFNIAVEPETAEAIEPLRSYIDSIEKSGFRGAPVQFKPIVKFFETVTISAGIHQASQPPEPEDGFDSNFSLAHSFALSSLSDWVKFTDAVGDAFQSKKSSDFLGFLERFVGDTAEFKQIELAVLAKDNTVLAELSPFLILEDNSVIEPESNQTPFFDVPFVRNCWQPDHENGSCFRP